MTLRLAPALLLIAAAGSAQQLSAGGLDARARAAAADFATLTVADADDAGSLRWAAWGEGRGDGQSAHLALFRTGDARATAWSRQWPDGYLPTLNTDTRWRWHGQPVAMVTVQFGAGAVQVVAVGVDGASGRTLAQRDAVAAETRRGADGKAVLVLFDRPGGRALVPRCLGWQDTRATLTPVTCPR